MEVVNKPLSEVAKVIWHPHPVTPIAGREMIACPVTNKTTVRQMLVKSGIDTHQPIIISLDDKMLTVEEWDLLVPKPGQIINVQATVMGGGGGGGSNPLAMVAQIALIIAVTYFTMGAGSAALISAYGATAVAIGGAVAMIGGSMLISAMFPPKIPSLDSGGSSTSSPTESTQAYSLSGGSNSARQYQAMPVVMGKHRLFPDMAARPFTEFIDNSQYLYQIFHLGVSDISQSGWMIGTNSIENYADYRWHPTSNDGKMLDFPSNVTTVQGAPLTADAGWITRTGVSGTYRLGIDIESTLYYANNNGGMDATSVSFEIQYKLTTSTEWTSAGTRTITGSSQSPLRNTYFVDVPVVGAYDVRLKRSTPDTKEARIQNKTNWSGLRSYQADNVSYHGQNRVGITMRASEQLSGSIQQMSVMTSSKANYFDGSKWVYAETSNPAHWFMDFALGRYNSDGKLMYGVGLSKSQIDTAQITSWAKFCTDESLTFNAVIDGSQSSADILTAITRCGFGSASWASGKLGVVWDGRNQSPVAAFGMSNIIKDTFEVTYITEQLAEEIIVRYRNPTKDWGQDEVRVLTPGVTAPARTSTVDLFGCTNTAMAGKMANYLAAQQAYRKRRITWETDAEGFVCQRGDVVLMSHDLTQWGYSGRLKGVDGNTINLDREVASAGVSQHVMIKRPDGLMVSYSATPTDDLRNLILSDVPDLQSGHQIFDHIWFFSPLKTTGKRVKILSIQPTSETRLRISATDEYPEFYSAWDGEWIEPERDNLLPAPEVPVINNLKVTERLARMGSGQLVSRVTIGWDQQSSQVERVDIRYRLNGGSWMSATSFGSQFYEADLDGMGYLEVSALPINKNNVGSPAQTTVYIYGISLPPGDVTGFTSVIDPNIGATLSWSPNPDLDIDSYEIRSGGAVLLKGLSDDPWDSAGFVANTKSTKYTLANLPSGLTKWYIKAKDTAGNYSANFASTVIQINQANQPNISGSFAGDSFVLKWDAVIGSLAASSYEVRYGDSFASGVSIAKVKSTIFSLKAQWSGSRYFWVAAIDLNGNYGEPGRYEALVQVPKAPSITVETVDNNVLLRWSDATRTIQLDGYKVKKGDDLSSAVEIGSAQARFSTIFETSSGKFTYWIAGVDAAGNVGEYGQITAFVNPPPNYDLQYDKDSKLDGTVFNGTVNYGVLTMPINVDQTLQSHFDDNGWTSPQQQIDAGYPMYIEPTNTYGYYEEVIDYGAVIPGTKVTFTPTYRILGGSPKVTTMVSIRAKDTDQWIDYPDTSTVFATNFRYAKMRFDIYAPSGKGLIEVSRLNTKFEVKSISDSGMVSCNAVDANGTRVYFKSPFISITSISVSPQGKEPKYAIYDFVPTPNPKYFDVYLFDINGNRISGSVSWNSTGV